MQLNTPAVIITVRTESKRLPKKCLLKLNGKTIIEHIIDRAKLINKAKKIVLCTTNNKSDDILCDIAEKNEILFFRGSSMDKLMRWYEATKEFRITHFVTFDADDLFCEPYLNNEALKQIEKDNVDFIFSNDIMAGAFTYCIKTSALKKVCEIKDTEDTEMMWTYFLDTGLFNNESLNTKDLKKYNRKNTRITLDYIEDYKFFKEIFNILNIQENNLSLLKILSFLNDNPYISDINYFRDDEWSKNQEKKTNLKIRL